MKALSTLNPYFWKHRWMLAAGVVFIFLANYFTIVWIPFLGKSINAVADAVSNGLPRKELSKILLKYSAIIIGSSVLSGFFRFMMRQTVIVTSRKVEYELKNKVYEQYQKLSLTDYKRTTVGDLLNRLSEDIVAIRMYLGPGIMYIANLLILLIITSIFMFRTDFWMSFWTLIPLPIMSFLVYKISSIINQKSKIMQKSQSAISTFVQDSFSGIRVIKFFNKEKYIEKKYGLKVEDFREKALDLAKTEACFSTIVMFIIGLVNLAIIFIGGEKFISGEMSVGTIADFFMYTNTIIWPFGMVGWVVFVNQRAEASMQRVNEFMNIKSEIINTNFDDYEIFGDIEFNNVSYTYPNTGIKALDKVSFKLNSGKSLAVTGKIGSGKTTIALLLCRLIDADEGEILIDGKNIKQHNINMLRKNIGYIPQESFLFSDTIENNIGFAVDGFDLEKIEHFAEIADVAKNISEFNEGYKTMVGERGVTLSGGQKQRICIARALIKKPKILIFDDSLSALDTETEDTVLNNISKEIRNATSIFITHRESTANKADERLELEI